MPQNIDSSVFYYYDYDNYINDVSSDTLYVPAGSLAAYQAANVWKDFGYIIGIYILTFNSQDGSPVLSQTVEQGEKASQPAAPTRAGYTFGGWYQDTAYTNAWNFATDIVSANTTLYAKWTTDNNNGNNGGNPDNPTTAVETQNLAALQIYPNPTSDQITITSDQWNDVGAGSARPSIEIYNVNGTLVGAYRIRPDGEMQVSQKGVSGVFDTPLQGITINIAHLPAGIYLVKVGNRVGKVVKQ
ncbi:hypothetical protein AGMMS4956_11340 [Bacteroidia bacterium]|nr:hypothetical protein AGMMS4956_11340 [Bacteroidia bacterium]